MSDKVTPEERRLAQELSGRPEGDLTQKEWLQLCVLERRIEREAQAGYLYYSATLRIGPDGEFNAIEHEGVRGAGSLQRCPIDGLMADAVCKESSYADVLLHIAKKFAVWKLTEEGWAADRLASGDYRWKKSGESLTTAPASPAANLFMATLQLEDTLQGFNTTQAMLEGMAFALALEGMDRSDFERYQSQAQSSRAKKPRSKPRLGSRALMIAMTEGNRTAASIAEFFDAWRGKFKDDEWGGLSLDAADDFNGWEVIDEGASIRKDGEKPSGEIRRASLASMISRAKKKPR